VSAAPTVLVTRPAGEAGAFAARLSAAGWRPILWPLLEIAPTGDPPDLAAAQAVLLTSANAARAVTGRLGPPSAPRPRALCVGAATARAAGIAGFAAETPHEAGDGAALAAWSAARLDPAAGEILFLRGAEIAGDPAGALRAAGFAVREQVVYAARPATAAPPAVDAALAAGAVDAAAFFSPRAAATFARLAQPWRAGLAGAFAAAISAAAARPLAGLGFGRIAAAARPEAACVEALLSEALEGARERAAARASGRPPGP
jgi:uroporphyrinogen-III synthase